jgi:hypothetical protein
LIGNYFAAAHHDRKKNPIMWNQISGGKNGNGVRAACDGGGDGDGNSGKVSFR